MLPPRNPAKDELARFLASRRGRVQPKDVGLPEGGGRRAGGLRREEVAALSGISLAWYTRLEQGRDVRVSSITLERIAASLRLDAGERRHLFFLAGEKRAWLERYHADRP